MPQNRNLAARAGRWSAGHRKAAILGWLILVVAAVILGRAAGMNYQREEDLGTGQSGRADKIIAAGFADRASERVLIQSRTGLTVNDPQFTAALGDVEAKLRSFPFVTSLRSPLAHGASLVSPDRRSAMIEFAIQGDSKVTRDRVEGVLAQMARAQAAHPGFRVEELGDASASRAIGEAFTDDARRAEVISLPITLLILVAAFGTLVAAGLPLLLGLTAVGAAIGLLGPVSHLIPVAESITSVVLLVGLAVGVDYSMFYIRRERDERAAGRGNADALEVAAATSGRAVLVSGLTVMVAMSGMFVVGNPVFESFAVGTIMVVAVAMLGSITVVPAMLATLGDRIDRGRLPLLFRRDRSPESGAWAAIVKRVLGRPWLAAGAAVVLLVTLASPTLRLHTADSGVQALPRDLPIMQTYARMQRAFPGGPLPAIIAVRIPRGEALKVTVALTHVREHALATGLLGPPFGFSINDDRTVAIITMAVAGRGTDATSNRALAALRDKVIPPTLGRLPGVEASVTGTTAMSHDFNALMKTRSPWVFAFVLSLAFVLLLVTFRSLVIPLTAIVLNLLSVGAAYGVLVWIFQDGHLQSALDFTSIGGVTFWLPLFLFVILFGLSMDYHVFILSRIREGYDRGLSTDDAIAHGIRSTAGVVTSAAIVMVAVFGVFATLRMLEFKQMGVGLALAVLIDATIIRAVLLPATMKLLGNRNWYLPRWLEWLPQVTPEPATGSTPTPPKAPVHAPARPTHEQALLMPRSAPLPSVAPRTRVRRSGRDRAREMERVRDERELATLDGELHALDKDIAAARRTARRAAAHPALDLHRAPKPAAPRGERVRLRDGAEILIRDVEAEDATELARSFQRLGAMSRYQRFLTPIDRLNKRQLAYLTQVDHTTHEAIAAIDAVTGEGIGIARYVCDPEDRDLAEVAVVVDDRWQGRGVGTALAERLAGQARTAGVNRLTARMLVGNEPARRLLAHVTDEPDEKRYAGRIELTARLH